MRPAVPSCRSATQFMAMLAVVLCLSGAVVSSPDTITDQVPERSPQHQADHLRVVVWNIQRGANNFENGPEKALDVIRAVDADICLLQESYDINGDRPTLGQWMADTLNAEAGSEFWTAWQGESPHLCVLTRLRLDETHFHRPWHGVGATLRDEADRALIAWSIWFDWRDYLPYALRDNPHRTDEELLQSESVGSSRLPQAKAFLEELREMGHLEADLPVLVGGDFNCPSHLDWTEDTALVYRFRRALPLPVSLAFIEAGFADAYRAVYPEPVQHPGITWSPLYRGSPEEPQTADRIDRLYTHAATPTLKPVAAWTLPHVYEDAGIPQADRRFPSDHAAVVVDLAWEPGAASEQQAEPERADAGPTQPFFTQQPRWRPIYQGIEYAELATDVPRDLVVQVLRIDTVADGLEIVTTPSNGDAPLETDAQTTRQFLEEHDLSVAINTHFFDPCCNRVAGEDKNLIGLSIAQGELVSPHTDAGQRDVIMLAPGMFEDDDGLGVGMFPGAPDAETIDGTDWLEGVTHAIAGRTILSCGLLHASEDEFATAQHPRTLVGYSHSGEFLYLVTIDGRQPGFSTGASLAEAAGIMHFVGAWHALNVDGGGSTTMIIRDADGASQLANSPSGGAERFVGSNLGLRARPLQPEADPAP